MKYREKRSLNICHRRMNSDDLPSWVFFPDKERAEWVNNIMKQLWPYVNECGNYYHKRK